MAQVVNETDKLTYILTNYGSGRVAEALADTTVNLYLTKIKVGNANYEYYEPSESATNLVHPIENGEFSIIEKELLEDGLTVSLHCVFPESFNNCEIREIGIYETVNGEDHLFALSTQQPLLKPSVELNYFTTVDYYAFLKSQNLSDVYDQIILDPDNQMVTKEDFDNLVSTIAFTEGNLMEQINGNSRVIGLNRAQQLKEKIDRNRENFGYVTAYNNYSLLLNYTDPSNIFGYWLFNYPRRTASTLSVTDISKNNRNLSTNKPINTYDRVYSGVMPTLKFAAPDYYYLDQGEGSIGFNRDAFTIIGEPFITTTGVASGFSSDDYVECYEMDVVESDNNAIYLNFTVSNTNYDQNIAHTANPYTFRVYFRADASELFVQLGDGTQWITTLYFTVEAGITYDIRVLFNDTAASLSLLSNGTYVEKVGEELSAKVAKNLGMLTLGSSNGDMAAFEGSIDLKQVSTRVNGVQVFSGSTYIAENDLSFVTDDRTSDLPFTMGFAVEPLATSEDRTLLARSNYATNSNIFEVTETADNALQIKLFADSANYMTFNSGANTIPTKAHSIVFSYDATNKSVSAFAGGHKLNMSKTVTGTYNHMNDAVATLYAFTYTENGTIWANSPTQPTELYNENGTPYVGHNWVVSGGSIFFNEFVASYRESHNAETELLYAWNYNDGLDDHTIYTKEQDLVAETILYNPNYTEYTGSNFRVIQSGSAYIIQYDSNTTEYDETLNIPPKTLYNYYYEGTLETVWANNSAIPSVLYDSNGNLYEGTDWTLDNNTIYYKDGGVASYDSLFNIAVPSIPVTSYVINSNGNPSKFINSDVGAVTVIKEALEEGQMRSFALNLESTMGNNPCISIY